MKLVLTNFMSHAATEIDLPHKGIVQVTGPNGAGKSAIIEGIATALWGKSCRYIRWSPWREDPGAVVLHDGSLKVEREWTGKAKKLWWTNGGEERFDTTTKAQESLETIVGPFDVWRRTCVFSSADAAHFTLASDAERKELLEQLLGLGWFDRALATCRADLRSARSSLALAEKDREVLTARIEGVKANLDKLETVATELPPAEDVGLLRADVSSLDRHVNDLASELRDIDRQLQGLSGAGATEKERASVAAEKLRRLKDDACYACGQAVSDAVRASLQHDVSQALADAANAKTRVQAKLDALSGEREDLAQEQAELRKVRDKKWDRLREVESNQAVHRKVRSSLEEAREQVAAWTQKLSDAAEKEAALKVDVAELEACDFLLGTRGVRAHVVGRTLGSIEALANSWMHRLGSTIQIGLKPYTEKKSGGTVDAISLTLFGAGGDQGYLGASAGERRRVDVAVLLSLAELASARSTGAAWQSPIFFDEVFDSLDVDGRDAVIELVQQLAQERCVVLITHDESIASARADLHLRIDGGSVCR